MELDLYKILMEMDQKLNALIEKVYAKEIAEQQAKQKGQQQLPTPVEEADGFDSEGVPEIKSDPSAWRPAPMDDGLIDEEEEAQEFQNFQEQQEQEEAAKKARTKQLNAQGPLATPLKKRNVFLTED